MARELRVGDRVRTPLGVGVVMALIGRDDERPVGYSVGYTESRFWRDHDAASVTPLPADIPRERVADLHAAVHKRLVQLEADRIAAHPSEHDIISASHTELATFAKALYLLLEPADD